MGGSARSRDNVGLPMKYSTISLIILMECCGVAVARQNASDVWSSPFKQLNNVTVVRNRIFSLLTDMQTGNFSGQEAIQALLQLRWGRALKMWLTKDPLSVTFRRPNDLSLGCYQNLLDFIDSLVGAGNGARDSVTEPWALRMLDACGKPSAGLLEGVFQWVGNYEECLNVRAKIENPKPFTPDRKNTRVEFGGRYCRLVIPVGHIVNFMFSKNINKFWLENPTFPTSVKWGVCVPETCSSADVKTFLTKGTLAALHLPVHSAICFGDNRFSQDTEALTVVVVLCVVAAAVIVCTFLDIYYFRPCLVKDLHQDGQVFEGDNRGGASSTFEMKVGLSSEKSNQGQASRGQSSPSGGREISSQGQFGECSRHQMGDHLCFCRNTVSAQVDDGTAHWVHSQSVTCPVIQQGISPQGKEDVAAAGASISSQDNSMPDKIKHDLNTTGRFMMSQRKTVGSQLIQGMSLYRNLCYLLRKKRTLGTFDCIQGMRVISLAWIVLGHCYTYGGMLDADNLIFENTKELVETSSRLSFHIVGSAHLAVDTFFVISGCLTMLVTLRLLRRNKPGVRFWSTFFFHRFWRLTPMYLAVMMLGMTLYDHIVQGPLKSDKPAEFEQCRHKWWSHIVYINNFYKPHSKCMTWSWFMAVDMQLFLVSPIFIYTVHRNLKVGMMLILLLLVFGMTSAFVSEYVHGGQFVLMDLSFLDYWSHVYTMPWARASVFAVGLALGVALYKHSGRPLLSKWKAACVWLAVAAMSVFLVLINHSQWKGDSENWDRVQQSFYESFVRPSWSLCMAWVVFACCTDMGALAAIDQHRDHTGVENSVLSTVYSREMSDCTSLRGYANVILSWRPFLVLSRLTYSLYLLHPMVIMFVVYSRHTTIYLDPGNMSLVYNYMGNLTLTFLLSAVLSLMFEMPMAAMENIFWRTL